MRAPVKVLVATSIAHFINDGTLYIFITLFPKLLPSQLFLIGVLGGMQNLSSAAASPFVGRRADKSKNYGSLLSFGLILMAVGVIGYAGSVLFFRSGSVEMFFYLLPFTIIAGIGSSFYHPIGAAAIHGQWGSGHNVGRAMGFNGAMGSLGRALYPLFVVTLVVYFEVPSISILAVVTFVGAAIASSVFRGVQAASQTKQEALSTQGAAAKGSNTTYADEKRQEAELGDEIKNKSRVSQPSSVVPMRDILPRVFGLSIISFMRSILSSGVVYFIPVYLATVRNFGYGFQLGIAFSSMLGMAVIGQPIFGSLADRIGRRTTLGISIAGASISMILFVNTSDPLLSSIILAMFGFFVFTAFPLLMPLANSVVPEGAGTTSGSIVWGIGTVGGMATGPFIVGLLSEKQFLGSLTSSFYVVSLIALFSLVILPFVPNPRKNGK